MAWIIFAWNAFGAIGCIFWSSSVDAEGFELFNPYWAYRYHKQVNWFGATMLSLTYTVLCPVGAVVYWFYKLCTVGRR